MEARRGVPWRSIGPYLSERQWGTVREDVVNLAGVSDDVWTSFSHDHARSRAYRWGEDGLAGISDSHQHVCFALAFWNENDPILKERLFGLTNEEGNHGEDVKEYYFYVDNLPTHAFQLWRYKYPQAAYPYVDLIETNRARSRDDDEYELLDTGIFDDDRYFDIEVAYAKASPEDVVCRITVHNRGPDDAPIHLLPTVWCRNTWAVHPHTARPVISAANDHVVRVEHPLAGTWQLHAEPDTTLLFCDNDSNVARLSGAADSPPFPKDGIHDHVVFGSDTVNPARTGTKAAVHSRHVVPAGGSVTTWLRLTRRDEPLNEPFADAAMILETRRVDADEFYASITPPEVDADAAAVMRQSLAGMLWAKQTYYFDVDIWLRERHAHPLRHPERHEARNEGWFHMSIDDVISMPDTWEYPWFAAWDLAFHCVPLAMVDPDFAIAQLDLLLGHGYLHPNGQIPAYEWNFSDVNPPVHAFAALFAHQLAGMHRRDDIGATRQLFTRLLLNFTWWVNRKDRGGRNLFEGGFLGLDNIGVFDRSSQLPTGGHLEQADGTAWMALYSLNMLELALVLYESDRSYADLVMKFVEHFFWIAAAVDPIGDGPDELWDEEEGFFFDVLRRPDGSGERLKVRSLVGLLPLCATTVIAADVIEREPELARRIFEFVERNEDLLATIANPLRRGVDGRYILSLVNDHKLRRILERMLDEDLFLGPHGIRSLSRVHLDEPFELDLDGVVFRVQYEPGESRSGMFGGNSNWRGPVWLPMNVLIIRSLLQHYRYYGDAFRIECPTGSGNEMNLYEVAKHIADRLIATFLVGADGRRPSHGKAAKFRDDPTWRDLVLFYEYFHGDDGTGLGASHQTGWTGLVAPLIQMFGHVDAETLLHFEHGPLGPAYRRIAPPPIYTA